MATVTMIVTEQVVPNTPDHVEEIAILMPHFLTQIQPQIEECPGLVPRVMVQEVVPEADRAIAYEDDLEVAL